MITSPFNVRLINSTWLKAKPVNSSGLTLNEKIALAQNAVLNVAAIDLNKESGHHLLTLAKVNGKQLEYLGKNTWWVFGKDVKVEKNGELYSNNPVDAIGEPIRGRAITIPGIGEVGLDSPIISRFDEGGFLTWSMATHGGTRMPNERQAQNIFAIAMKFEREIRPEIEKYTRNRINITSWFRPEPFNSRAGGVYNSVHLDGGAIDFWVDPLTSREVYNIFDLKWSGGFGCYANGISHADIGPRRRWFL